MDAGPSRRLKESIDQIDRVRQMTFSASRTSSNTSSLLRTGIHLTSPSSSTLARSPRRLGSNLSFPSRLSAFRTLVPCDAGDAPPSYHSFNFDIYVIPPSPPPSDSSSAPPEDELPSCEQTQDVELLPRNRPMMLPAATNCPLPPQEDPR